MLTFFYKSDCSFSDVSPNICEKSFFNFPSFFPHETSFTKSILNIPGKEDVEAYSELSRTSNMELCAKLVKGYLLLTTFAKSPSWMFDWVLNTPLESSGPS